MTLFVSILRIVKNSAIHVEVPQFKNANPAVDIFKVISGVRL